MTKMELIKFLTSYPYPDDMEIWVATECHGCFGPATSVRLDERGVIVVTGDEKEQA